MGEFGGFWGAIRVVAAVLFTRLPGWRVDVRGRRHLPDGTPAPRADWWVPARLRGSAPDQAQVVAAQQARHRARRSRNETEGLVS